MSLQLDVPGGRAFPPGQGRADPQGEAGTHLVNLPVRCDVVLRGGNIWALLALQTRASPSPMTAPRRLHPARFPVAGLSQQVTGAVSEQQPRIGPTTAGRR